MINRRRVGNEFERKIAKELRELYPDVQTARYASKQTDDNGIDLVNTGSVAIQLKRTLRVPQLFDVMDKMKTSLMKVIIWKNPKIRGEGGELAIVSKRDLYELLRVYEDTLRA